MPERNEIIRTFGMIRNRRLVLEFSELDDAEVEVLVLLKDVPEPQKNSPESSDQKAAERKQKEKNSQNFFSHGAKMRMKMNSGKHGII